MVKQYRSIFTVVAIIMLSALQLGKVEATPLPGNIAASPSSGSHLSTEQFNVQIVVNSSEAFTTFGATVSTSNLSIISFTRAGNIIDCTTTPSKDSLNFFCGVQGSINSTIVYTLKVKGINSGTARINISNCSINHTDGITVSEICGSVTSASFTITTPTTNSKSPVIITNTVTPTVTPTETFSPIPSPTPTPTPHVFKVIDDNGNIVLGANVTIDGKSYTTDNSGQIYLTNLPNNNAVVSIASGNSIINGKVLSISDNVEIHTLVNNPVLINSDLLIAIAIILIGGCIILVYFFSKKKKDKT